MPSCHHEAPASPGAAAANFREPWNGKQKKHFGVLTAIEKNDMAFEISFYIDDHFGKKLIFVYNAIENMFN